ncbi:hypothetical protein WR25_24534 [Diploscapter pachys]|uniref:Uncharacterized protein n=1 Tax=Diploscapter pachys TaxID=2018661 RepID=A0A2A2JRI5_9BILA|nr:hypothetical protein WR25_24534 [Diploscapter pachys]
MSSDLNEDELVLPPADVISKWGEATGAGAIDERRTAMEQKVLQIERALETSITSIHKARTEIEETRLKYENMTDVIRTMEGLKGSLEEHMKTIRLNESSFAGTSSVLEYDEAKRRTNELINVIRARSQWQQAKEALNEGGSEKDNQQRLFECLVAMQQSNATLSKYVHKPSEVRELEELKDKFLSWQSAALIFAIQQVFHL